MKDLNILLYIANFFETKPSYQYTDTLQCMDEIKDVFKLSGEEAYYYTYRYLRWGL